MHGILVMPAPDITVARSEPQWQDWLAARTNAVSASDIAAILGLSPWDSAFSVYWRKKLTADIDPSPQMEWGSRLEDAIADKYATNHPDAYIARAGLYRHPRHEWMLATPDRILCDRAALFADRGADPSRHAYAALELKTAASLDDWGDEYTDQVPVHYRAQVIWQLDVLGLDRAHVALLCRGSIYREYVVDYDDYDAETMRKAGAEFMRRIAEDNPPDIDGSEATTRTLKKLHPSVVDEPVDVPPSLAERYREARAHLDAAQALYDGVCNEMRDRIGDYRFAVADGRKVAYRSVYDRRDLNRKALKADHPDLYAQYEITSTVDVLKPAKESS